MSLAAKVKAILSLSGISTEDYAQRLGVSAQSVKNKQHRGSYSVSDLIRLAECCDAELCFRFKDGNKIVFNHNDIRDGKKEKV